MGIDTKNMNNYGFIGKNRRDILSFLNKMDEKFPLSEIRPEKQYLKIKAPEENPQMEESDAKQEDGEKEQMPAAE